MGTMEYHGFWKVLGLLLLGWGSETIALKDVQMIAPSAVRLGDTVLLGCTWKLEGNETLYSVKWYRGRQEFFSFLPKEYPFTRIFAQPGIDVDVSRSSSNQVVLRDATRALAGRYRCEISADAPSFHTQVRSAYIHVVELPSDKPTIKAEKGWYASGDSLRAQCTSPPADPPANLTWLLNGRDIQGKPIIQQRILPSPAVSIEAPHLGHAGRSTVASADENTNIIFSPWKAFGPFVDSMQEGELLLNQDTVVLPTPRHQDPSLDDDSSDPMPTAETSNKVASVSQLSFMVRPDSFERGQLRLTCISSVHSVYNEQAELVINEERPQIASVLGTRDAAGHVAASAVLVTMYSTFVLCQALLRQTANRRLYSSLTTPIIPKACASSHTSGRLGHTPHTAAKSGLVEVVGLVANPSAYHTMMSACWLAATLSSELFTL